MKTTKLFFMAALALLMTACSSNDDELNPQPADNMITVTAKLAPKSAVTRAMTDNGTDIVVEWAETETMKIISNNGYEATATIDDVTGGVATISFTINANAVGKTCLIVYPASAAATTGALDFADNGNLTAQDGTLNINLDVRVGTGTINADDPGTLTVTTEPVPQNAIFKFTIQDLSGAAKTATQFKVSDNAGNVITTVTPGSATGTLYVALPVMAVGTYWFNATIDSKPYIAKATTSAVTGTGNFYSSTVKMATIGNVIGIDGKFYANYTAASNASTPTTAMAMITYLGRETGEATYGFTHGLALAMTDANSGNTCQWRTSNTDAGHTKQASESFTNESGLQYNDATHNTADYPAFFLAIFNNGHLNPDGCSDWFLPTAYQWNLMINAAGNYATLRDGFSGVGGENMVEGGYWSSTEKSDDKAWSYTFYSHTWLMENKNTKRRVRSAIAF